MNIAKIPLSDIEDLDFSVKLKLFVLLTVRQSLYSNQTWLLYLKPIETRGITSAEYFLLSDNKELFDKTLDLVKKSEALNEAPDDLEALELTYGFQSGSSIGLYNC